MFSRVQQQKLRLRELHIRKAQVEFRADFGFGECAHLIVGCLALVHCILRHLQHSLRGERLVKGLIDSQGNVELGGALLFELGLGVRLGAQDQIVSAAEVGDQLVHRQSARGAVVDGRIVQQAGGDAAALVRADGGQIGSQPAASRRTALPA